MPLLLDHKLADSRNQSTENVQRRQIPTGISLYSVCIALRILGQILRLSSFDVSFTDIILGVSFVEMLNVAVSASQSW